MSLWSQEYLRHGHPLGSRGAGAGRLQTALCCPDKFRGSLTAAEAATAIGAGLRDAGFEDVIELPLADGGEGTLAALVSARRGEFHQAVVTGPDGQLVDASWGMLPDGTAVIELAEASGLALVSGRNDPLTATTKGTGELILAAAEAGASNIILGLGGSATVDGGRGIIDALGGVLPVPVVVACDVDTLFEDAARVFGPQKGADPADVGELSRRLERLALDYAGSTGVDVRSLRGSGAAGGTGGGLAAIGATLRRGFDVVAEATGFSDALARCTFVVTGEGRLDRTSLAGKVTGEVVAAAKVHSLLVGLVVGDADEGAIDALWDSPPVVRLVSLAGSREGAIARASELARVGGREIGAFLRAPT